jgi:hypothetical protein
MLKTLEEGEEIGACRSGAPTFPAATIGCPSATFSHQLCSRSAVGEGGGGAAVARLGTSASQRRGSRGRRRSLAVEEGGGGVGEQASHRRRVSKQIYNLVSSPKMQRIRENLLTWPWPAFTPRHPRPKTIVAARRSTQQCPPACLSLAPLLPMPGTRRGACAPSWPRVVSSATGNSGERAGGWRRTGTVSQERKVGVLGWFC